MSMYRGLNEFVGFNSEFRNAINLDLNLNHREQLLSYIPTKSSVEILKRYLKAVQNNTMHASMLIGPYGKGKSHLLLVLLAIVSLDRKKKEDIELFQQLYKKIEKVDIEAADYMNAVCNHSLGKFLPVIINSQQDVAQAFLLGLNKALNRNGLSELTPKTDYIYASEMIDNWQNNYPETYTEYHKLLHDMKIGLNAMKAELLQYNREYLDIFKEIYPKLTSGSTFNPLAEADVTRIYMSVASQLREEYGYRGIYIVFDEFSKFIEGQDKISAGLNMKLVQDVCEMCGNSKDPQIHITLVAHKPIREYGNKLKQETINSFTGIEGRLESEVLFVTSAKNNYELIQNAILKKEDDFEKIPEEIQKKYFSESVVRENFAIPGFESEFTYDDFKEIVAKGCYPMTPISSYLLLSISEKVAQNERTLFTFISKDEPNSMPEYIESSVGTEQEISNKWAVTPDLIYDYFTNLFKEESDEIKSIYQKSVTALEFLKKKYENNSLPIRIIKTLAVMMIVDKSQELPWNEDTLRLAVSMNDSETVKEQFNNALKELIELDILDMDSANFFKFKTLEGKELKAVIEERWRIVANESKVSENLQNIFKQKYVFPKKYNYEYGMTRYFRYSFYEVKDFLSINSDSVFFENSQFCDGKIICLYQYDEEDYTEAVHEKLANLQSHKLIVLYSRKIFDIEEDILKLQVVNDIREDYSFLEKNEKLISEIQEVAIGLEDKISEFLDNMYGRFGKYEISYFLNDAVVSDTKKTISECIDELCYQVYYATPIINNEFVNKQFITTGATKSARKGIIENLLVNDSMDEYLTGTSQNATIYRALFVRNGIKTGNPEKNIAEILVLFEKYIAKCVGKRKPLSDLLDLITKEPYGMRLGLIPLYLAYIFGKKDSDIVIYFGDKEIPISADTIINMCENPNQYDVFVSENDAIREEYLDSVTALFDISVKTNNAESRMSQILSGMQKWYRALPQVTVNIKKNLEYFEEEYFGKAISRINRILQRYDVNPYEALFIQIPEAFSVGEDYRTCIERLSIFKAKLDGYYGWMVQQAINKTKAVFEKTDDSLYHIMKEWYELQSNTVKGMVNDQQISSFMKALSSIVDMQATGDEILVDRIVKAVSGVHIDYWNASSLQQYTESLKELKEKIESIQDNYDKGSSDQEVYTSRNGQQFYYNISESEDSEMFRDVLSGTIEDFEGLGKNDIISVLLDEVERILQEEE